MAFASPMQKLQDWFTQQWVIIRGRKIDREEHSWLIGPFGQIGGIGNAFVDQLAAKEGLIVRRSGDSGGLISSFGDLNLPESELSRLSKAVIDFYENTPNYDLAMSVRWNPFVRIAGVLINKLFSERIKQLNLPTRNVGEAESLTSEIISLVDPTSNESRYTIWLRTVESSGLVVYSGVYSTCILPSGKTCIKAVFPLPNGNATVLLTPSVGSNGELILESQGKIFGDTGFYFLLQDSNGNVWAQFVRSFRDRLMMHEQDGHLAAEQTLTLFKLRVVTFGYRITPKNLAASACLSSSTSL